MQQEQLALFGDSDVTGTGQPRPWPIATPEPEPETAVNPDQLAFEDDSQTSVEDAA